MKTPRCGDCKSDSGWVIRRELVERKSWDQEHGAFMHRDIECTELDVFCSVCNSDCGDQDFIDHLSKL